MEKRDAGISQTDGSVLCRNAQTVGIQRLFRPVRKLRTARRTGEYVAFAYDGRPCDEGEAGICGRNDPEVSGKTCAFYNVRDDPAG